MRQESQLPQRNRATLRVIEPLVFGLIFGSYPLPRLCQVPHRSSKRDIWVRWKKTKCRTDA